MTTWVVPPRDLGRFERKLQGQIRLRAAEELRRVRAPVLGLLREQSAGIRDQGIFQRSWRATARFLTLEVWNEAPHALFVEGTDGTHPYSRRPNRRMPPLQVIRDWLERRGADPKLAYPVARAIASRGIQARPVLRSPDVQERISVLISRAMIRARDAAVRASR